VPIRTPSRHILHMASVDQARLDSVLFCEFPISVRDGG
jgi:hypothetical protein